MPPIRPSLICERIEAQLVAQGTAAAAQKSTGLDSAVLNVEILWEIRQAQVLLGRLMLGVLVRLEFPAFNVACVQFRVVLPFFWQIIERKNCGDGANGHTSSAIDALHGVNVKLRDFVECWPTVVVGRVLLGVNAVHGTSIDASGIFRSDAGLGNDVCHEAPPRVPIPDYSLVWRRFKPRSAICQAAERTMRASSSEGSVHEQIVFVSPPDSGRY